MCKLWGYPIAGIKLQKVVIGYLLLDTHMTVCWLHDKKACVQPIVNLPTGLEDLSKVEFTKWIGRSFQDLQKRKLSFLDISCFLTDKQDEIAVAKN